MASTLGLYSTANTVEETTLRGVRRSRFSFHFMTHRTRRWLLVQWVSAPVSTIEEEQAAHRANYREGNERRDFQTLLSNYTTQAWLRRCA